MRVLLVSYELWFWRLTPERARIVLEKDGWPEFIRGYAPRAWIEIDAAHDWLRGWLDDNACWEWVSCPDVNRTLEAAAKTRPIWTAQTFRNASRSAIPSVCDDQELVLDLPAAEPSAAASANTGIGTTAQKRAQSARVGWLASFAKQGRSAPGCNHDERLEAARRAVGSALTQRGFSIAWDTVKDRYPDIQALWSRPGPRPGAKKSRSP